MKLYPHQVEALRQAEGFENTAFYLDMGLGKTFVGSEKAVGLGKRVNIIICQKSKIEDWLDHIFNNYEDFECYDLTKKDELSIFTLRSDDEYEKSFYEGNPICGVINYELAWRRKSLLKLTNFTLMLDESSLIQNRKAKQTKFILSLKPKNVILLSGTPTAGKYENLWTQASLLGWEISEDLYNRQYVNWKTIESDGFYHKVVDMENPYKNVERLKSKLREHGAVFMKTEDVFDLPEQTFTVVKVATSPEYRKFMEDSIVDIENKQLIGDQAFSKRLYARQLCGMYSKAKLEAFTEMLQSTNDRVIVFYNFKEELTRLTEIAIKLGRPISQINGSVKDSAAYEQCDDSVTFVQYQAGAMGLNLQKANKMIYFSLPERSDLFEQSKKRIHRMGQNKPCFYWILICDKSVEELIYETLQMRRDFTDELFETL